MLHLIDENERFWLNDDEIKELLKENEPYQRTVPLEEMIAESFRKPKDNEGRWWGTSEILNLFASKYAYFEAAKCSPNKLGRAMNNYRFSFKHRVLNGLSEYWLMEK